MEQNKSVPKSNPRVLSVPQAGKEYFGMGRAASYEAAKRGDFPIIRIGRNIFVPIVAMERKLNECDAA